MADFDPALKILLANEGGLTDDPDDPGGLTLYGVTLGMLREEKYDVDGDGDVDLDDVRSLDGFSARRAWRILWDEWKIGEILNQDVANKIFDLFANVGFTQGSLFVQRALLAIDLPVREDGKMGPKTRAEVNIACRNIVSARGLLYALRSEAAGFYRLIANRHPPFKKFIKGWLTRAYQ